MVVFVFKSTEDPGSIPGCKLTNVSLQRPTRAKITGGQSPEPCHVRLRVTRLTNMAPSRGKKKLVQPRSRGKAIGAGEHPRLCTRHTYHLEAPRTKHLSKTSHQLPPSVVLSGDGARSPGLTTNFEKKVPPRLR